MRHDDADALMRWGNDKDFAWFQWGRAPGRWPDRASAIEWIDRYRQVWKQRFDQLEHHLRNIQQNNKEHHQ